MDIGSSTKAGIIVALCAVLFAVFSPASFAQLIEQDLRASEKDALLRYENSLISSLDNPVAGFLELRRQYDEQIALRESEAYPAPADIYLIVAFNVLGYTENDKLDLIEVTDRLAQAVEDLGISPEDPEDREKLMDAAPQKVRIYQDAKETLRSHARREIIDMCYRTQSKFPELVLPLFERYAEAPDDAIRFKLMILGIVSEVERMRLRSASGSDVGETVIDFLLNVCSSDNEGLRLVAIQALGNVNSHVAYTNLLDMFNEEQAEPVRLKLMAALAKFPPQEGLVAQFLIIVSDTNGSLEARVYAIDALSRMYRDLIEFDWRAAGNSPEAFEDEVTRFVKRIKILFLNQ